MLVTARSLTAEVAAALCPLVDSITHGIRDGVASGASTLTSLGLVPGIRERGRLLAQAIEKAEADAASLALAPPPAPAPAPAPAPISNDLAARATSENDRWSTWTVS